MKQVDLGYCSKCKRISMFIWETMDGMRMSKKISVNVGILSMLALINMEIKRWLYGMRWR
jgi:hypothetical protein